VAKKNYLIVESLHEIKKKADYLDLINFLISNKLSFSRPENCEDCVVITKPKTKEQTTYLLGYIVLHELNYVEDFQLLGIKKIYSQNFTVRTLIGDYRKYHTTLKKIFSSARVRRADNDYPEIRVSQLNGYLDQKREEIVKIISTIDLIDNTLKNCCNHNYCITHTPSFFRIVFMGKKQ